jgi:hypothetical protein
MKGINHLQGEIIAKEYKYIENFLKTLFSRTIMPNSIKLNLNYLLVKGIQICTNRGPGPLERGGNHKNVKMGWGHLRIFSGTSGTILTTLGTNHPCGKGIQVCSIKGESPYPRGVPWVNGMQFFLNKRPGLLQRGDYHQNVKIEWGLLKIYFSGTTILTRVGTNHPWGK